MITDILSTYDKYTIYGAQLVAYGTFVAIKQLLGKVPECFIVTDTAENPSAIEDIPVLPLESVTHDTLIIIAVTELLQGEIATTLVQNDYSRVFVLTAHEEYMLMSAYYTSIGKYPIAKGTHVNYSKLSLYQVRHHLDKPLRNRPILNSWEVPIQAGAALTDIRICDLLDSFGESISVRNRQYYEATAMYWVWKNVTTPWVGIEHYRRRLLVYPDMLSNDIDAILPLPYICYPDSLAQFRRFVSDEVVEVLLDALKAIYPDDYDNYVKCLNGKYHYAYNLIAAKQSVFADYCEWAFRITDHIESLGISSIKETRALSYVMEMLTSIYFISNKKGLSIRHAEKAIYT